MNHDESANLVQTQNNGVSHDNEGDRRFAVDVVRTLRSAGFEALWAGGCVRDLVMGRPSEDYDVATSATPDQVRDIFGRRNTLAVGAAFGVIIVLDSERKNQAVEVATFRMDAAYSDGRRPDSITFSTAEEDAKRRDFTINGMFYDPLERRVIDYVGGQEDLQRRLIRAIGIADERIAEDKLRMLRAIRFAARFGFTIEDATRQAIARHASTLKVVSGERIAVEVQKTLLTKRAAWGVAEWASTGLLGVFLPEIDWADGETASALLDAIQPTSADWHELAQDWRIAMAAVLWGAGSTQNTNEDSTLRWYKSTVDVLRERLHWSNDDAQCLDRILQSQHTLEQAPQAAWSVIQPLLVKPHVRAAVQFLAVRSRLQPDYCNSVAWLRERLEWPAERLDPAPLLDGQDLIGLGWMPGPAFKLAIQQVRQMQLDGQLQSRDEAIAWASAQ